MHMYRLIRFSCLFNGMKTLCTRVCVEHLRPNTVSTATAAVPSSAGAQTLSSSFSPLVCRFLRKARQRNGVAYTQYVRRQPRRVGSHLFLPESKRLSVEAGHLEQPHRGIPSSLWVHRPCCIFQPATWPGSPRNRASVDSSRSSKDMLLMPRRGPPCGGNDSPRPTPLPPPLANKDSFITCRLIFAPLPGSGGPVCFLPCNISSYVERRRGRRQQANKGSSEEH